MKMLEYDRGVAPSSSIKKSCYSERFQEQSKRMASEPTFLKVATSPDDLSDVNQEQISQKSENRQRAITGITIERDRRDNLGVVKNQVLSIQNKHVSAAEENGVYRKTHVCSYCKYKTPKKSNLQRHIDAIHEGKRPYQCQMCDYSTSKASNLKTHVHSVHEGIRRYKCKQCDYRASQAEHLRTHVDAVHERKKPYECQHCDYRASQAGSLRTHVDAVHEGKKPHPCHHCDYRTAQITHLRRHVRAVHERMKPYGCRICDYRAALNQHLRQHMKAVHGGKENSHMTKE